MFTLNISRVSSISLKGIIWPKLFSILNGAANISPPSSKPSVKGLGFKPLRLAPPELESITALFKSETKPDVDVSQNISSKLSCGSVS